MIKTTAVIKLKFENENFKVLEISGHPGDQLNEHKVNNDALIQLLNGSVIYQENLKEIVLSSEEIHIIPKDQLHQLKFVEDSRLLLILPTKTKMQFSKQ